MAEAPFRRRRLAPVTMRVHREGDQYVFTLIGWLKADRHVVSNRSIALRLAREMTRIAQSNLVAFFGPRPGNPSNG